MKVLLIDDNHDITTLISEFLREKGIDIVATNDPKKGLDHIKEEKYDIVITVRIHFNHHTWVEHGGF